MSDTCCGGACAPGVSPAKPDTARSLATRLASGPLVVISSGLLIIAGMAAEVFGSGLAAVLCFAGAIGLAVPGPARRALRSIRHRALDIHVLMMVAVAGAVVLGEWLEAAAVVWLFGIAQWLEHRSLARARRAIRQLMTLTPLTALIRRGDVDSEVPVDDVVVGDRVLVRPGGRVPVDGYVVQGQSAIDQSPVTGESWPVDKGPGDDVFAGSINGNGALEIEATQVAAGSMLARIIALVEQAQAARAPVQAWVDRFARRYTPAVVVLAAGVAVLPPLLLGSPYDFSTWVYRALALLVVACPCALVISTPVSIVSALTAAMRAGVLIKGGVHLERLAAVRCVAFDKTGTLTSGRIAVDDVQSVEGTTRAGVLAVAAGLEHRSEHPIGRAIVARAREEAVAVLPGADFRALPGLGAEATVDQVPVIVGSHRLFEERQLCSPWLHAQVEAVEARGRTPVLVGRNGAGIGVLALSDDIRDTGRRVVAGLRDAGVARVVLLTGDRASAAEDVRDKVRVDEMHTDLMPQDKVAHVQRLRAQVGTVAMVGDGINDAPALAAADVGIAMGVAGTDVAIETADVALLTDDLAGVPYVVRLGRATMTNIRTNVAIALGLKLAFVALAIAGTATLWMAVLADTGASLLVTANGLRLLRLGRRGARAGARPGA